MFELARNCCLQSCQKVWLLQIAFTVHGNVIMNLLKYERITPRTVRRLNILGLYLIKERVFNSKMLGQAEIWKNSLLPFFSFFFFNVERFRNLRVSSLHRGHAKLFCIFPILVYVLSKRAQSVSFLCFSSKVMETSTTLINYAAVAIINQRVFKLNPD